MPIFTLQPQSTNAITGDDVTLTSAATGGTLVWQWLLNGSPVPGETTANYALAAIQPLNAGNYRVVAGISNNSIISYTPSHIATVTVNSGAVVSQTNGLFANRLSFDPLVGPASGNNASGTTEPGQPLTDGKPGGRSIWFTWHATFTGIISLTTRGSDFDTLMAVYTGANISHHTLVAADYDSGGFFTSLVTFQAQAGTDYQICIDGFEGATGNVLLGLPGGTGYQVLTAADAAALPVITQQPSNQIVQPQRFTLSACLRRLPAPRRWSSPMVFLHAPIPDAAGNTLVISNIESGSVGAYQLLAANEVGSVQSSIANVTIGSDSQTGVPTYGTSVKFGDALDLASSCGNTPQHVHPEASAGDTRGFSVTHVFTTSGATKEAGEPDPCGQIGGRRIWACLHRSALRHPARGHWRELLQHHPWHFHRLRRRLRRPECHRLRLHHQLSGPGPAQRRYQQRRGWNEILCCC